MANSEINRKTLLTGIIDTNSKSEISIFQMRLRVSPTMVSGDGTTPVVLGRRLADDRCR